MNRRNFMAATSAAVSAAMLPWSSRADEAGPRLTGYLRTNWSQDPFSFGSYSHIPRGTRRREYGRLAEPVGDRLFFAGEAAHPARNSTVHAAHESGLMAAEAVQAAGHKHVAIIGGGMSGLTAAHRLSAADINVSVFEARDRLGGRINTVRSLGLPLDCGASWLHGMDGNPLTEMVAQADMPFRATSDSWIARRRGAEIPNRDIPGWIDDVMNYQHSAAIDKADLNRSAYWFADDYGGDEVIFPGGYDAILEQLNGPYAVATEHVVSEIKYTDDGIIVTANDTSTGFDAVIVTVPLGVLKQGAIIFTPPLPKRKQDAIDRLGMGTLDKVYLQFEEVFWDAEPTWLLTPFNDLPRGHFNAWLNFVPYTGAPIIMAFNGGSSALALAGDSDERIIEKGLATLRAAYG